MSFVGGIHGFATDRFTWGVSGSLGAHEADLFLTDTVNASLGPDTPTSFKLGGHRQREVALHANSRSQESIGDGDTWRVLGQYSRMDILGHGIDLVEIDRVETLLMRSDDFLLGWFTTRELSDLQTRSSQARVVAGRVAAKEAAAKALGSGFAGDVSWQDIEILATDTGAPIVELSGGALELARSMGVAKLTVSISHERAVAVASVIAVGAATPFRGT